MATNIYRKHFHFAIEDEHWYHVSKHLMRTVIYNSTSQSPVKINIFLNQWDPGNSNFFFFARA